MNLAIIPARGGSKRIPRKNLKDFCGKPIIAYSIETAINSDLFDKVIVSTDDEEIAKVARRYGAEVPFMRPKELADDYTGTTAVAKHALKWFSKKRVTINNICLIYATAPLLKPSYILNGYDLLRHHNCDSVFASGNFVSSPQRALKSIPNQFTLVAFPDFINERTQDIEHLIYDAGQFYWMTSNMLLSRSEFFSTTTRHVQIPKLLAHDIDSLTDWEFVEHIYKFTRNKTYRN